MNKFELLIFGWLTSFITMLKPMENKKICFSSSDDEEVVDYKCHRFIVRTWILWWIFFCKHNKITLGIQYGVWRQLAALLFEFVTKSSLWIKKKKINDDVLKSSVSYGLQSTSTGTCGLRTNGPNRRHWCGTGQEPSECQVSEWEISKNSIVRELRIFCVPKERRGLVLI